MILSILVFVIISFISAFLLVLNRKRLNPLICKYKGHNWSYYSVSTGYGSNEVEQAGECTRCGFDTHAGYED